MAARGDHPLRIKQRAGHASFSTTEGYIREAENLGRSFGTVFPPLPSLERTFAALSLSSETLEGNVAESVPLVVGATGFEPADFLHETARNAANRHEPAGIFGTFERGSRLRKPETRARPNASPFPCPLAEPADGSVRSPTNQ